MNNLQRQLDSCRQQLRLSRQKLKRTQDALDKSIDNEQARPLIPNYTLLCILINHLNFL